LARAEALEKTLQQMAHDWGLDFVMLELFFECNTIGDDGIWSLQDVDVDETD